MSSSVDPPPTDLFVSWFERHASERDALAAAILGLFLAAFFGLLSLVIGNSPTCYSMTDLLEISCRTIRAAALVVWDSHLDACQGQ
ncbi:hypothetical protein B0H67DRAFT_594225 [Lasiosphaeris hirsuta]|uniref:Uncharacterized protein n=1 Tax=Lasiosphaeris hirsuta TaxID=260670 RepID=A0AA39ZXK5_9PEZI|nr:hypothetical protein B0H67DRAFT_594225 [Lasiosphaeris hirsuta]